MPQVRKYNKRKQYRRKKYVPGIGGAIGRVAKVGMGYVNKGGIAWKALRLARKVANAVNVEYKHLNILDTSTASYNGYFAQINNCLQGTTDSNRIGDSIKCQNLTLRATMTRAGSTDSKVRCLVIWDKQAKTTSASDVLEQTGNSYAPLSPKNYDKRFQTKVLFDRTVILTSNDPQREIDVVIPIDQHTQYVGASNVVNTGFLGLIFISDQVAGATAPAIQYYARMTFTDN